MYLFKGKKVALFYWKTQLALPLPTGSRNTSLCPNIFKGSSWYSKSKKKHNLIHFCTAIAITTKCEKEPKRPPSISYFLHTCTLPLQVLLLGSFRAKQEVKAHTKSSRKKRNAQIQEVLQCCHFLKSHVISEINATQQYWCLDISPLSNSLFCTHDGIYTCRSLGIVQYILYSVYNLQTPLWNARSMVFGEHSGRSFARLVTSTALSGLTR